MDSVTLIIIIIVLVPLLYLLYFWVNSEILSDDEINELANSKRFWDIYNYLGFSESQFEVNKDFKSALNKNGQLYNCAESLNNFPSVASALLKGKKHEWIIFAFAKNKMVYSFYTNKGNDSQSVAPNLSSDYINKIAKDGGADLILEFHNHPNAVLSASQQDITSAKYFGKLFTENRINYLAFVSGTGRFNQYGWWFTDDFFNINNYLENIKKDNGTSRRKNYDLRKELKRKKYFKDFRLNNASHNISIARNDTFTHAKSSQIISLNGNEMDYKQKVLKEFKSDLTLFPKQDYIRIEKMGNRGDEKNETWNKYYYKLSIKEFSVFDELALIDHSDIHKSFIFSSHSFTINDIKNLVATFTKILGVDSFDKGNFSDEDLFQITTYKFWSGRLWEKKDCFVMLDYDFEETKLDLCIKW